jgi:long-chain acyl-CoA synthetase
MLSLGASMALCEAVDKIIANLAEVKPTVLMSVPRIFNRIYDGVNKQMAEKPEDASRTSSTAASRGERSRRRASKLGLLEKVTLTLADKVVFTKIVDKFGGRLKYAFSGGAALSREVAEFIDGSASPSTRDTASPRRAPSPRRTAPARTASAASVRPSPA